MNVFVALTQIIQLTRAYNYAQAEKVAKKQGETAQEQTDITTKTVTTKN